MIITGRIFEIVIVNDAIAHIVIKKKDKGKIVPVAITVSGYWKDKALKELQPRDKIRGNLYLKSRLYNNRYYTDVFFREIYIVEKAPVKMRKSETGDLFDPKTGEVFQH